ncbi:hypothetical protein [Streptomyces misionensis]|uniref:hypothetical protein n=1 Tax=Streptomyces misionensis TaxID=67331 RepID=UPI0036816152
MVEDERDPHLRGRRRHHHFPPRSLLEHARAAAAAIRARVAAVADIALAAVNVAATVFVRNDGGRDAGLARSLNSPNLYGADLASYR